MLNYGVRPRDLNLGRDACTCRTDIAGRNGIARMQEEHAFFGIVSFGEMPQRRGAIQASTTIRSALSAADSPEMVIYGGESLAYHYLIGIMPLG